MGRHGVAGGFDGDQPLTAHHHTVEEALISGASWQGSEVRVFLR
jgi:hypothetical protein